MAEKKDATPKQKIPFDWKRCAIAPLPFMGMISFWQVFDGLVPKMLTQTFGLSNWLTGVVMALDNIFGLILLPWFGILSDRCRSRLGRRTPFILAGSAVAAVSVPLIAVANNLGGLSLLIAMILVTLVAICSYPAPRASQRARVSGQDARGKPCHGHQGRRDRRRRRCRAGQGTRDRPRACALDCPAPWRGLLLLHVL